MPATPSPAPTPAASAAAAVDEGRAAQLAAALATLQGRCTGATELCVAVKTVATLVTPPPARTLLDLAGRSCTAPLLVHSDRSCSGARGASAQVKNAVANPDRVQFRRIRLVRPLARAAGPSYQPPRRPVNQAPRLHRTQGNKAFKSRLGDRPGGLAALMAFGFELVDDPKATDGTQMLLLPPGDWPTLRAGSLRLCLCLRLHLRLRLRQRRRCYRRVTLHGQA